MKAAFLAPLVAMGAATQPILGAEFGTTPTPIRRLDGDSFYMLLDTAAVVGSESTLTAFACASADAVLSWSLADAHTGEAAASVTEYDSSALQFDACSGDDVLVGVYASAVPVGLYNVVAVNTATEETHQTTVAVGGAADTWSPAETETGAPTLLAVGLEAGALDELLPYDGCVQAKWDMPAARVIMWDSLYADSTSVGSSWGSLSWHYKGSMMSSWGSYGDSWGSGSWGSWDSYGDSSWGSSWGDSSWGDSSWGSYDSSWDSGSDMSRTDDSAWHSGSDTSSSPTSWMAGSSPTSWMAGSSPTSWMAGSGVSDSSSWMASSGSWSVSSSDSRSWSDSASSSWMSSDSWSMSSSDSMSGTSMASSDSWSTSMASMSGTSMASMSGTSMASSDSWSTSMASMSGTSMTSSGSVGTGRRLLAVGSMSADMSASDMSVSDMSASGMSASDMSASGMSASDLSASGMSASDMSASDMSASGMSASGMSDSSSWMASGMSASDMSDSSSWMASGMSASDMSDSSSSDSWSWSDSSSKSEPWMDSSASSSPKPDSWMESTSDSWAKSTSDSWAKSTSDSWMKSDSWAKSTSDSWMKSDSWMGSSDSWMGSWSASDSWMGSWSASDSWMGSDWASSSDDGYWMSGGSSHGEWEEAVSCRDCFASLFGQGNDLVDAMVEACMTTDGDACEAAVEACDADEACREIGAACAECDEGCGDTMDMVSVSFYDAGDVDVGVTVHAPSYDTETSAVASLTVHASPDMCETYNEACLGALADSRSAAVAAFASECLAVPGVWDWHCWRAANACADDEACGAALFHGGFEMMCCEGAEPVELPCADAGGIDGECAAQRSPESADLAECLATADLAYECFAEWAACEASQHCEVDDCCVASGSSSSSSSSSGSEASGSEASDSEASGSESSDSGSGSDVEFVCDQTCFYAAADVSGNQPLSAVAAACFGAGEGLVSETLACAGALVACELDAACGALLAAATDDLCGCDLDEDDFALLPSCADGVDTTCVAYFAGEHDDVSLLGDAVAACLVEGETEGCTLDAAWEACVTGDAACAEAATLLQYNCCGVGKGGDGFGESRQFSCHVYDDSCVGRLAGYDALFGEVVDVCFLDQPLAECAAAEEACEEDDDCAVIVEALADCCRDAMAVIVPGDDLAFERWDDDAETVVLYYVDADADAGVALDGSLSLGPDLAYMWSTGDETAQAVADVADEDYEVSLLVVDSNGMNDTASVVVSFWESPVVGILDGEVPSPVVVGEAFVVSGEAEVSRGEASFVWTATPIKHVRFSDRYAESTEVTVSGAVDFSLTLTVTTTDGFVEVATSQTFSDTAYRAPVVSLDDVWVPIGDVVLSADVQSDETGLTYAWACDAGCALDDETAEAPTASFAEAGAYEVTVTVTSADSGLEVSATATVTVQGPDASTVVAGGYADPAVVDPGVDTTLVSTSYSSLAPADSAEAGLEVQWFWVSGPACVNDTVCPVEIADAAAEETAVTGLDASGEFVFNVSAVDSLETRAWALVSVYVNNLPQVEVGDHHTYWAEDHPEWVWLNATAADVEDNGLTWAWAIGDTCDISTVEIEDPSAANTRVRGVGVGICEFEFTATDGDGSSTTEVQAVQVVSLTITSPTAASTWFQGSKYTVTWDLEGVNADNAFVFLQLREDGAGVGLPREFAYTANSKSYSVPVDYSGSHYNGPAFTLLLRVEDSTYGELEVESETAEFPIGVPHSFSVGDWGECELAEGSTCGDGTQTRTVACTDVATQATASSFKCRKYEATPISSQDCFSCGDVRWEVSDWGSCSATCGGGTKTRTAACQTYVTELEQWVEATTTDDCTNAGLSVPVTEAACNWQTCVTYSWQTGSTGRCSASCGGGSAFRDVFCLSSQGTRVAQSKCSAATKPATTAACNADACATHYWEYSAYGRCSATCGGGTKTRTATCMENGAAIDDTAACTADVGAATALSKACNLQSCDVYSLTLGEWGDCSATCGGGTRTREVICNLNGDALDSSDACSTSGGLTVPRTEQSCANTVCAAAFCDGETCSHHGTCADSACACDTGYSGTYCQTADTCAGTTAADGSCCESGVLNNAGECCTGDSPVRDADGECCDGELDVCGVCGGDAVVVDISGTCCAGELDGGYSCCEDEVDTCGICGGDGTSCKTQSDITFASDDDNVDTTGDDTVTEYRDAIGALLGVDGSRISMGTFGTAAADRRRRRLATDYAVEFAVEPSATDDTVVNLLTVAEDLAGAEAEDIPGASSVTPGEVEAAGVCGNDIIESGECCAADGSDALTCCSADCPYSFNECPTPEGGDEVCGGRGTCIASSGACECYESLGYSGDDCSECASGFFDDGEGNCAVIVEVVLVADDDDGAADDDAAGDDASSGGGAAGAAIGGAVGGAAAMGAAVYVYQRKKKNGGGGGGGGNASPSKVYVAKTDPGVSAAPSFQPTS